MALDHCLATIAILLGFGLGSLLLFPRLGQDFFPSVDAGQIRLHVRAPAGTRIEETERILGQVEDVIRKVVPDYERAMILDNMGLTQSFTIMAYVDNGTVSNADGEILVALQPVHRPTADYVAELRRELSRQSGLAAAAGLMAPRMVAAGDPHQRVASLVRCRTPGRYAPRRSRRVQLNPEIHLILA